MMLRVAGIDLHFVALSPVVFDDAARQVKAEMPSLDVLLDVMLFRSASAGAGRRRWGAFGRRPMLTASFPTGCCRRLWPRSDGAWRADPVGQPRLP